MGNEKCMAQYMVSEGELAWERFKADETVIDLDYPFEGNVSFKSNGKEVSLEQIRHALDIAEALERVTNE